MTRHWLATQPKCPACNNDLRFWQSASKRCLHCDVPLKLNATHLLLWVPLGAFFGAAIMVEIPLHFFLGGAWPLLSVPAGVFASVVAWWATWRSSITVARNDDA